MKKFCEVEKSEIGIPTNEIVQISQDNNINGCINFNRIRVTIRSRRAIKRKKNMIPIVVLILVGISMNFVRADNRQQHQNTRQRYQPNVSDLDTSASYYYECVPFYLLRVFFSSFYSLGTSLSFLFTILKIVWMLTGDLHLIKHPNMERDEKKFHCDRRDLSD